MLENERLRADCLDRCLNRIRAASEPSPDRPESDSRPVLLSHCDRIIDIIERHPFITSKGIVKLLNIEPDTVTSQLSKLVGSNLVGRYKFGALFHYWVNYSQIMENLK